MTGSYLQFTYLSSIFNTFFTPQAIDICNYNHSPQQLSHLEFISQFTSDIRHIKGPLQMHCHKWKPMQFTQHSPQW